MIIKASPVNSTTVNITWQSATNDMGLNYIIVYSAMINLEIMEPNTIIISQMDADYFMSSGSGSGDTDFTILSVLVSGLDPFTNYTFYVLADIVAPSEPSSAVTVLTGEAGECINVTLDIFNNHAWTHTASLLYAQMCACMSVCLVSVHPREQANF